MDQYSDLGGVSLVGNKDMSMDSNFLSGNAFIMDGRMIKEGEKDVCVISAELADKNQLEIGSRISFGNCRNKEDPMVYEAEVVGIYQVNQPIAPYMYGDTYRSENIILRIWISLKRWMERQATHYMKRHILRLQMWMNMKL